MRLHFRKDRAERLVQQMTEQNQRFYFAYQYIKKKKSTGKNQPHLLRKSDVHQVPFAQQKHLNIAADWLPIWAAVTGSPPQKPQTQKSRFQHPDDVPDTLNLSILLIRSDHLTFSHVLSSNKNTDVQGIDPVSTQASLKGTKLILHLIYSNV